MPLHMSRPSETTKTIAARGYDRSSTIDCAIGWRSGGRAARDAAGVGQPGSAGCNGVSCLIAPRARTILASITRSVVPPIKIRCRTLSHLTSRIRCLLSTVSITLSRVCWPSVEDPYQLNKCTSHAMTPINASATTNEIMNCAGNSGPRKHRLFPKIKIAGRTNLTTPALYLLAARNAARVTFKLRESRRKADRIIGRKADGEALGVSKTAAGEIVSRAEVIGLT